MLRDSEIPPMEARRQILELIAILEARIADCQRRLPAHSIQAGLLVELDELDEQLAEAHRRLRSLDDQAGHPDDDAGRGQ